MGMEFRQLTPLHPTAGILQITRFLVPYQFQFYNQYQKNLAAGELIRKVVDRRLMSSSFTPRISPWVSAAERVSKVVFRVEVDTSSGTCFAVSCSETKNPYSYFLMLATAYHVVKDRKQDYFIRLTSSDETMILTTQTNDIMVIPPSLPEYDIALLFVKSEHPLIAPEDLPLFQNNGNHPARGTELGWLGYPGVVLPELCFFLGSISGYQSNPPNYLIDGVAINGVSGGPAFNQDGVILAAVQRYLPNRLSDNLTLPGLMGAVPISSLMNWMSQNLNMIDLPSVT